LAMFTLCKILFWIQTLDRRMLTFSIALILYSATVNATENYYSLMTNGQCQDVICYNKYSYRLMTNGECEDVACYNKYSYRLMTNGQCQDVICYNKYSYRLITNGECEDAACYNKYSYRLMTNGECEDAACYNKKFINNNRSLGGLSTSIGTGVYRGSRNYNYDISGYGDQGYAYGNIDTSGNGDVDGYIYLEDGREVYFEGEFVGNGEIEGYDEDGNWYEFEVD
jgi:hypothetical protein